MADTTDTADDPLTDLAAHLHRPLLRGPDATAHESPWRGTPGRSLAVALPTSVEEVRSIVSWARHHRVPLLPQGAVTGLVGASTPPPGGPPTLVVSTDALREPLSIDPVGATAVVGAGVRLSELNDRARRAGLELPVDLGADPALGAMVATNTGGSRVLRHGDMSHHVLDVEAVIADDAVSVLGGRSELRKDNTGPETWRLLVGSAGAFGIITAVSVALSPIPPERATAILGPLPDTSAVDLLAELRRRLGDHLSAYEVMCPVSVRAALAHGVTLSGVDPGTDPDVTVLVEASGDPGVGDHLVEAVATSGLAEIATAMAVPPSAAWALRHAITPALAAQGTVVGFDLSVSPTLLPELRHRIRDLARRRVPDAVPVDFGHWGDGGVHANLLLPTGVAVDSDLLDSVREDVYGLVEALGGSFSAEHGIGPLNAGHWLRSTPPAERAVLRSAKESVDPCGILGHPGLPLALLSRTSPPPAAS